MFYNAVKSQSLIKKSTRTNQEIKLGIKIETLTLPTYIYIYIYIYINLKKTVIKNLTSVFEKTFG